MYRLNFLIWSTTKIYRTIKIDNTWFRADYTDAEGNKIKKRSSAVLSQSKKGSNV